MDELVRQLAEENPVAACDALPLSEIWSRIERPRANESGGLAAARRVRLMLGTGRGGLATGGAVLVAILVAVLALGLRHRAELVRPGARTAATPAGLVRELGVLRRPQTAEDRTLARIIAGPLGAPGLGSVVPRLTRLVAKLPNGRLGPVYVYVVVQPPNPRTPAPRGTGVAPQASAYSAAVQLTAAGRGGGWDVGETARSLRHANGGWPGWGYYAALVPDGVARVRWRFVSARSTTPVAPLMVTAAVHNNVAIAKVPENSHGMVLVRVSNATWYSTSGRVIGTYSYASYLRHRQRLLAHRRSRAGA